MCGHEVTLQVLQVLLNLVLFMPLAIPAGVHPLPNVRHALLQPCTLVLVHLVVDTRVVVVQVGQVTGDVGELRHFGADSKELNVHTRRKLRRWHAPCCRVQTWVWVQSSAWWGVQCQWWLSETCSTNHRVQAATLRLCSTIDVPVRGVVPHWTAHHWVEQQHWSHVALRESHGSCVCDLCVLCLSDTYSAHLEVAPFNKGGNFLIMRGNFLIMRKLLF